MTQPVDVATGTSERDASPRPRAPQKSIPSLSPSQLARWAWRQLTSMRTALLLLLLLALAAVPGSVIPQTSIDPSAVFRWQAAHPRLTPVYDKLGLFAVFRSAWFSAIYLLLMVSLVGCVLPRLRVYWAAMRARPPRAPRHLSRLPAYCRTTVPTTPEVALRAAKDELRGRRFRVAAEGMSISAQRGYLREAGNLLFHTSVLLVLITFAYGKLFGFVGGVIVVTGETFTNSVSQYDEFTPGALFDPAGLSPFNLDVNEFRVKFLRDGPQAGQPLSFAADVTYRGEGRSPARAYKLEVNHPLTVNGTSVFLVGHGYAPLITVRDGNGDIAYQGHVNFLPQDATFASYGVIKAPDAQPEQLGFEGQFLPTYAFTMQSGPYSAFPDALNPALTLLSYHGNLGIDDGRPQSVYDLDKTHMRPFKKADGKDFRVDLALGRTMTLPNGGGTISFDRVDRWVKLQVSESPGKRIVLAGALIGIVGLLGSLYIRPRRVWARTSTADGRTVLEVAGLDRSQQDDLQGDIDDLTARIQRRLEEKPLTSQPPQEQP